MRKDPIAARRPLTGARIETTPNTTPIYSLAVAPSRGRGSPGIQEFSREPALAKPGDRRLKIHSTNPLERLNGEIKRRTEVVGIFPTAAAIIQLAGAIRLEQNDQSAVRRARYMTLGNHCALNDDPLVELPAAAA